MKKPTQPQSVMLEEYSKRRSQYDTFASRVRELIEQLLHNRGLRPHSVTARAKTIESLKWKLARSDRRCRELFDVTDLCGVRVTTYFIDDVDLVCETVEREFEIDPEHSGDRRVLLDPDRFGYVSVHYVARLDKTRSRLIEWRPFRGVKFEVQVRSILQHAWAEIEHDLGYKSEIAVPRQIRRRFSRLAGLLELADAEFADLRREIVSYRQAISRQVKARPRAIALNRDSLLAFVHASPRVKRLDQEIAHIAGGNPISRRTTVDRLLNELAWLGIANVQQLDDALAQNERSVVRFAKGWLQGITSHFPAGICIFYVAYVLLGRTGNPKVVRSYLDEWEVGHPRERAATVRRILTLVRAVDKRSRGSLAKRLAQHQSTLRSNQRMEPSRAGSRSRAAHS